MATQIEDESESGPRALPSPDERALVREFRLDREKPTQHIAFGGPKSLRVKWTK